MHAIHSFILSPHAPKSVHTLTSCVFCFLSFSDRRQSCLFGGSRIVLRCENPILTSAHVFKQGPSSAAAYMSNWPVKDWAVFCSLSLLQGQGHRHEHAHVFHA